MSTTKKYYFFQISEEKFFDNVRVKALEMDGPEFVLSFQRLVLKAIKTNEPGLLALDPAFDTMPEQISTLLSCPLKYATEFYNACVKRHLFEETDTGIQIPLAKELTASRTEKADEMKKRRQLERTCKVEDGIESKTDDVEVVKNEGGTKGEKCYPENRTYNLETKANNPENTNLQKTESKETVQYMTNTVNSSKGRINKEKADPDLEPAGFRPLCKRIVNYLNEKTGYDWHPFASFNSEPIRDRLAEGFVEQDFYDVIDVKTPQWQNEKMRAYLRPCTLFGEKMDKYLQETNADKVFDPNSSSFKLGNAVFNGEGHIFRGKDAHRPADPDFVKPKSFLGEGGLCTR